jgi:hypothetical protein
MVTFHLENHLSQWKMVTFHPENPLPQMRMAFLKSKIVCHKGASYLKICGGFATIVLLPSSPPAGHRPPSYRTFHFKITVPRSYAKTLGLLVRLHGYLNLSRIFEPDSSKEQKSLDQ